MVPIINTSIQELDLSVLMCAARLGHLDIMKLLIEFGAEPDAVNKVIAIALRIWYNYSN